MPGARHWIRRVAPWVITALVLAVLLHKYPVSGIARELRRGDAIATVLLGLVAGLGPLFLLAVCDHAILRVTAGPVRYLDVVAGRAGTSVLNVVANALSQGAYGTWLVRKTGIDARTAAGVILYGALLNLAANCIIATAAIWVSGAALPPHAGGLLLATAAGAVTLLAMALAGPTLLRGWVRNPRVLRPWSAVSARLCLLNLTGQCLFVAFQVGTTWLGAILFGIDLPPAVAAAYLPLIMFVGLLPINLAGLGAVQAAWLIFEPWAPGERILGFQFLWYMSRNIGMILRGAPFVRRVLRDIETGDAASSPISP